ncbi:hypothetical protein [Pantoea stewartii]|uniref:hypothetical protein n=1 Tax=Pantoea stewartii TaxID=66269 RepID=UPI0006D282B0|nr:hypothetical protein [Pantoea stewartii]
MEDINDFIRELKDLEGVNWIANELDETLSQGVLMSADDADKELSYNRVFELSPFEELPAKERKKRTKYETTRPFTEEEKIDVIKNAFRVVFLDLPAVREAAMNNLRDFDNNIKTIVFSNSSEESSTKVEKHSIDIDDVEKELIRYNELHSAFIKELN